MNIDFIIKNYIFFNKYFHQFGLIKFKHYEGVLNL